MKDKFNALRGKNIYKYLFGHGNLCFASGEVRRGIWEPDFWGNYDRTHPYKPFTMIYSAVFSGMYFAICSLGVVIYFKTL